MAEDYYRILGIEPDAAPERIRQAYRREAKRHHPDSSGSCRGVGRFRAVEEAYQTLRDPQRRLDYDRSQAGKRAVEAGGSAGSRRRAAAPVAEAAGQDWRGAWGGLEFFDLFGALTSAELFPWRPGGEALLEVVLSPDEALRGVVIPVQVPLRRPCPECRAVPLGARLGGARYARYARCGGAGFVGSRCELQLEIPAGVRDGSEFRCELGGCLAETAAAGASFRVRIEVRPW